MYTHSAYSQNESKALIGYTPCLRHGFAMSRDLKTIAERLKLIRGSVHGGMTQAAFGRLVGIEPQAINNYETALRRISVDQAIKVCAATGVSLDYIYRGVTSQLPAEIATNIQKLQRAASRRS
ncbi:helix-turn-helix domain-containing protein [Bradyrhizobium sp. WSM4349]|uniref:helix-turn-helix domain-containing protein n=1 Tax=Bradyrhizobium sp. WSM4349 TaxID=1040988 RepID=UPI000A068E7E|nr:helix-turn-helix transcriptional regulator [Bradyrhizobium sp. WSM4349]